MDTIRSIRLAVRWLAVGVGLGVVSYATFVGVAWSCYGRARHPTMSEDVDPLLDQFIPAYEVADATKFALPHRPRLRYRRQPRWTSGNRRSSGHL